MIDVVDLVCACVLVCVTHQNGLVSSWECKDKTRDKLFPVYSVSVGHALSLETTQKPPADKNQAQKG